MGIIITVNGINSIYHYGKVIVDHIRDEAILYIDDSSRQTQNNNLMYRYIMTSLIDECSNKLINQPSEYTITIGNQEFVSTILLYKNFM